MNTGEKSYHLKAETQTERNGWIKSLEKSKLNV